MRPSFIGIGPGRSGTSWLHEILREHPEVCMGVVKEAEFFNTHFHRGPEWYESLFPGPGGCRAIGEISTNYYLDPAALERIRAYRPDCKIIMSVREPRSLLLSLYLFGMRRGLKLGELHEALSGPIGVIMGSGYEERVKEGRTTPADEVTLLDSVRLGGTISLVKRMFPEQNVYFFVYERIASQPAAIAREVFEFLGVDPSFEPSALGKVVNPGIVPRSPWMGKLAHKAAHVLRKAGAFRLLRTLHGSQTVRRLLFREPRQDLESVKRQVSKDLRRELAEERRLVMAELPDVEPFWRGV